MAFNKQYLITCKLFDEKLCPGKRHFTHQRVKKWVLFFRRSRPSSVFPDSTQNSHLMLDHSVHSQQKLWKTRGEKRQHKNGEERHLKNPHALEFQITDMSALQLHVGYFETGHFTF